MELDSENSAINKEKKEKQQKEVNCPAWKTQETYKKDGYKYSIILEADGDEGKKVKNTSKEEEKDKDQTL